MTRFARAQGSKSSNSRVAEEATNWSDFKRQNDQPKTVSKSDHDAVVKNAFNRIKGDSQKNTDWADFGVVPRKQDLKVSKKRSATDSNVDNELERAKKKRKKSNQLEKVDLDIETKPSLVEVPTAVKANKKKKTKKNFLSANESNNSQKPNKSTSDKSIPSFKRRKPYIEFSTIHINGISINVSKFDGFDVKHDDAIRLKETRAKMLQAGIPRAEVDLAIKRERRNAEKALAREKKKVCFNCRKSGHTLSDCPELGSFGSKNIESSGVNICYKCGSTEHTHFQCQVKKKKEYSFATCFICKEQGHISSQCPDNPKGLYPQGGSCKVCGEVTHLKKDCPQISKERCENTLTLDTIASSSNVESLGEEVPTFKSVKKAPAKRSKIVKF